MRGDSLVCCKQLIEFFLASEMSLSMDVDHILLDGVRAGGRASTRPLQRKYPDFFLTTKGIKAQEFVLFVSVCVFVCNDGVIGRFSAK